MSKLKNDRSENIFEDYKPEYNSHQAVAESNRCLYCEDAPCTQICPTHINIPEFIRKISTGNVKGAAKTIFESNILNMSCARVCPVEVLCVGDCVYNNMDQPPIQIGKLQRFATDEAFEHEWEFFTAGADSGKSVGLIGGGPASIAAAHELRRQGHACTIYEKRDVLGGLNTWGVAPYKLRADRALAEIDWVLQIGGIDIQCGVSVGEDVTLRELELRHNALFIGLGLGADKHLNVPGEDLDGVVGAVDYIERLKMGAVSLDEIKKVAVIGGGNTALDCVRELLGMGVTNVTLVYRGTESGMSGYMHEWDVGKKNGAHVNWRSQPTAYVGNGRVNAVECLALDENKQTIAGSEFTLPADLVLVAIGQSKLGAMLTPLAGVELDWGRVVVDEHGATGHPGVYAGGDCANGGKEVVNAVYEGKTAAQAMHQYLTGVSNG
ncbi:MAG TPA: NAD(P)-dependent oxidoreductase [Myxococcales bacterium]|nr:NAD(P)-dependent oxidoreductase [Myxococcales bacterium]